MHLRERATADIDDAVTFNLDDVTPHVALPFVNAIERTIKQIGRAPQCGSRRFAYELEIPDLRVHPVARFPHLVFYVVKDQAVDVWRVLHSRRHIPVALVDERDD